MKSIPEMDAIRAGTWRIRRTSTHPKEQLTKDQLLELDQAVKDQGTTMHKRLRENIVQGMCQND